MHHPGQLDDLVHGKIAEGRDMGEYVTLDSESTTIPFSLGRSGQMYREVYSGTPGAMGPWQPGAEYDIVAAQAPEPATLDDAVFATRGDELVVTSPPKGHSVDLSSDIPVTWEAGDGNKIIVALGRTTGMSVYCATEDDGSFALPADALSSIDSSEDLFFKVVRVYSERREAGDEVVHMMSGESVGDMVTP